MNYNGMRPRWWDANNKRAMLICRISDRKQKDGVSLDAQRYRQEQYVREAGLEIANVASFQESAKKSSLRREFHAALEQARKLEVRHLVFYVWDRIARNFTDAEILEELVREGQLVVHVASGGQVLHRCSPNSDFFQFDINIAQAKQDNRERSTKTIEAMEQRCRDGWYPARPPWGYWQQPELDEHGFPKRRGSKVAGPSPEARRLVRREMELHLAGYSLDRVRVQCIKEGLVPPDLLPKYRRSGIDKRLKQDFYAALPRPHDGRRSLFTWRGVEYEGQHEPIFTADEWERLQASFGRKSTYRKLKHEGLFNQGPLALRCGECGCRMTYAPKTKANGTTYHYYRCADGKRVHRERGEPQVNVIEGDILDGLGSALDELTITPELARQVAHELSAAHRNDQARAWHEAETAELELHALDAKEAKLFDLFTGGQMDEAAYGRQLARLKAEREALEARRHSGRPASTAHLVTVERVLELAQTAKSRWNGRSPAERRDLLAKLVCNPRIQGRSARYDLRKPFDVLAKMRQTAVWRPQGDSNPC